MSTVDLYDVLNLNSTCDHKDIKKAYRSLVKKFHPDHGGDEELFSLITHAFNVLKDPKSREEYDEIHSLSKRSTHSHSSLKDSFANYQNIESVNHVEKTKKEKENDLKRMNKEFDDKHGYNRKDNKGLSIKETHQLLEDLQLVREQDDIEYSHDNLFNGNNFNESTFNAMFDKLKEKGQVSQSSAIIEHTGDPQAWVSDNNYSSFKDSYDNLYLEEGDEFGSVESDLYGSFIVGNDNYEKLTQDDIDELDDVEYTKNHNKVDSKYNNRLEDLLRERGQETTNLHNMKMSEYSNTTGDYGIFDGIGDQGGLLDWEDDNSLKKRYERLLEDRKKK